MKKIIATSLLMASVSGIAIAQETSNEFEGTLDLGYGSSSGNSDAESLQFRATGKYKTENYLNQAEFQALGASQDGVTSKESYLASYQLNRDVSEHTSVFGRLEHNNDRFSGYDYQNSATVGASVNWVMPENQSLATDFGVGYRYSAVTDAVDVEEAIVRLAGQYDWQVTETTKFSQTLSSEIGEEATISRSVSSLAVAISDALALKLTYQVKYYSDPEPGTANSDRDTSVSINYRF